MNNTWIEGRQKISFPSTWHCIKLDQHRYYKRISGRGIQCVDFLAVDPTWGLFLVEIKDYTQNANIPSIETHHNTLLTKKAGSIKLIHTVNAALRRQWYYRIIFLRLKWYRYCPAEWKTWHLAEEFIHENKVVVFGDFSAA